MAASALKLAEGCAAGGTVSTDGIAVAGFSPGPGACFACAVTRVRGEIRTSRPMQRPLREFMFIPRARAFGFNGVYAERRSIVSILWVAGERLSRAILFGPRLPTRISAIGSEGKRTANTFSQVREVSLSQSVVGVVVSKLTSEYALAKFAWWTKRETSWA